MEEQHKQNPMNDETLSEQKLKEVLQGVRKLATEDLEVVFGGFVSEEAIYLRD